MKTIYEEFLIDYNYNYLLRVCILFDIILISVQL